MYIALTSFLTDLQMSSEDLQQQQLPLLSNNVTSDTGIGTSESGSVPVSILPAPLLFLYHVA
jgi:hypothetical protein